MKASSTAETLDGWRVAPLFDNGAAFFSRATGAELARERYTWAPHLWRARRF